MVVSGGGFGGTRAVVTDGLIESSPGSPRLVDATDDPSAADIDLQVGLAPECAHELAGSPSEIAEQPAHLL